jgi:hypothetical protein
MKSRFRGEEMSFKFSIAWIAFSAMVVSAALAAGSIEKIRNEKVLVTEETLAPGETALWQGSRPSTIVYLTGGTVEMMPNRGDVRKMQVKRGETVFQRADEAKIKNDGTATLKFVRIEYLTAGSDETWGMKGLSPHYTMIVENKYARAYDIEIPAQKFEPQHTHHARVVVCISGAELEHILPDGTKQPSTLKTGEIAWRPAATHIGHNMGHTDLWVIAIEPKRITCMHG